MAAASTILLVDDYPDALEVWAMYLTAVGFTVLTAADGPSALAAARESRPDLIVMDIELPGLSGLEVARTLRTEPGTQAIPLIAVTGYSQGAQIEEARRLGFGAVVVKPCEPDALVVEIQRLLSATPSAPLPN